MKWWIVVKGHRQEWYTVLDGIKIVQATSKKQAAWQADTFDVAIYGPFDEKPEGGIK